MNKKPRLLQSMVDALQRLAGYESLAPRLARSFDLVAIRRPELLTRSLFAERGHSTVQLELVFRAALKELEVIANEAGDRDQIFALDLSNLRFNHTTGKLHIGHSNQWVYVFPRPASDRSWAERLDLISVDLTWPCPLCHLPPVTSSGRGGNPHRR